MSVGISNLASSSLTRADRLGRQARTLTTTDFNPFRLGLYVACAHFFDFEILYAWV
jgi:hypothetical protein